MPGNRQYCLTHSSGEDIYLFTLSNARGTEVLISNYGAIITSFKIKKTGGRVNDIVLGFDKMEDYLSEPYLSEYPWFGCAIGRCANRIKNSTFEIDGRTYKLSPNKGGDHLHGGQVGFDKKVWKVDSFIQSPVPTLTLLYHSANGEEGYPGNLDLTLQFILSNDDELSYEYFGVCDQATVVNLAHHSYFNLDNGEGTIAGQLLKIHSSLMLDQDDNLVANGKFMAVGETGYDFKNYRPIGKQRDPEEGFDKSFLLDKTDDRLTLAAEAYSGLSGVKLQVFTTEPVVHFYAGMRIPAVKGKNAVQYGPYSGFCLETHKHPNAVNILHFPGIILRPGEKYYQKTVYKVAQDSEK